MNTHFYTFWSLFWHFLGPFLGTLFLNFCWYFLAPFLQKKSHGFSSTVTGCTLLYLALPCSAIVYLGWHGLFQITIGFERSKLKALSHLKWHFVGWIGLDGPLISKRATLITSFTLSPTPPLLPLSMSTECLPLVFPHPGSQHGTRNQAKSAAEVEGIRTGHTFQNWLDGKIRRWFGMQKISSLHF